MHRKLRHLLPEAYGYSDLIIAVFIDVRDFSAFNEKVGDAESALYVKRVFLRALDEYYPFGGFFKPTGDGLMLTFPVTDATVLERSFQVIESSLRFVDDFATLCAEDPIINFDVPARIGIGIARGAAMQLRSGHIVLDYAGRVLNHAARLMDLARPEGIVVHGNFHLPTVARPFLDQFTPAKVYVKGIAEREPISAFYLTGRTEIREANLHPLVEDWQDFRTTISFRHFRDAGRVTIPLRRRPVSDQDLFVAVEHRTADLGIPIHHHELAPRNGGDEVFSLRERGGKWSIVILTDPVSQDVAGCNLVDDADLTLTVRYR